MSIDSFFNQAAPTPGCQFDRKRHGGLYDRGTADSYYRRPFSPHWWPDGTRRGQPVVELTEAEIAEYAAGYYDNEANGDFKDYS